MQISFHQAGIRPASARRQYGAAHRRGTGRVGAQTMRPRRSRRRGAIEDLRRAIDCLPRETRVAMLDAVREDPIIAGAYTDGHGGMCPMLAAHRRGARTSAFAFARAWDQVATGPRGARRVGPRERTLLIAHLEASLDVETIDLAAAISEHQALVRARHAAPDAEE